MQVLIYSEVGRDRPGDRSREDDNLDRCLTAGSSPRLDRSAVEKEERLPKLDRYLTIFLLQLKKVSVKDLEWGVSWAIGPAYSDLYVESFGGKERIRVVLK